MLITVLLIGADSDAVYPLCKGLLLLVLLCCPLLFVFLFYCPGWFIHIFRSRKQSTKLSHCPTVY